MSIPADLFVACCEALEAAEGELDQLTETDMPASDALTDALRRQETAEAVLRRILRAAPPERKRRLGQMCRQERERHHAYHAEAMIGPASVMPEIRGELAQTRETIRRRAASDPAVADALRDVLPKGWAW